jgi:hypothetical protein
MSQMPDALDSKKGFISPALLLQSFLFDERRNSSSPEVLRKILKELC